MHRPVSAYPHQTIILWGAIPRTLVVRPADFADIEPDRMRSAASVRASDGAERPA